MVDNRNGHPVQPCTPAVEAWALHIIGIDRLQPKPGMCEFREAVELNSDGNEIISTFGNKTFEALIGFVDLRGFSAFSHNKNPHEIVAHASPYVALVVDVVKRRHGFVDKTMGDEVMFVLPLYARDVTLADEGLPGRSPLVLEATEVMAQILQLANNRQLKEGLVATFSPGPVTLTQVGGESFSEWSCYGEPIHVAQRLQSTKPDTAHSSEECNSWFALGTLNTGDETGEFWRGELEALLSVSGSVRRLDLSDWIIREEGFKGVGSIAYLAGHPRLQSLDE